ncbi:hypothetical protein HDV01_005771 [Terramyces sp. JEL0728]|nr:hypothetical protein HDV01_005771 [Terramyces sp. JEL0728]
MNEKIFTDILDNPYEPSVYFSGERHFNREKEIQKEVVKCDPTDVLSFNSILRRNSDTVLSEAKALLDGWVNNTDKAHVSVTDNFDLYPQWINPKSTQKERGVDMDIKRLIEDAVPKDDQKTSYQNLGMTLKVRQTMAKEKRMLLEQQRLLKITEREGKIRQVIRPKPGGIDQKTAIKIIEKEMELVNQERQQDEQLASLNVLIAAKKLEQQKLKEQLQKDKHEQLEKNNKEKLQKALAVVAIKYFMTQLGHEIQVQKQHEERARRMQEFLKSLEQKQMQISDKHMIEKSAAGESIKTTPDAGHSIATTTHKKVSSKAPLNDEIVPARQRMPKTIKLSKKDKELISNMKKREQQRLDRKLEAQTQKELKMREIKQKRIEEEKAKEELERLQSEELKRKRQEVEDKAKQILIEKEKQIQAHREMLQMARLAHGKMICRYYGIEPWKRYLSHCRSLNSESENFYNNSLKCRLFSLVKAKYLAKLASQEQKGIEFERQRILGIVLTIWKKKLANQQRLSEYAQSYYLTHNFSASFKAWSQFTAATLKQRVKVESENARKADLLAARLVPKRTFRRWKVYVQLEKEEKWREYRRNRLRQSAQQILSQNSILETQLENAHIDVFNFE